MILILEAKRRLALALLALDGARPESAGPGDAS